MFLALAVLLIHPQIAPALSFSASNPAVDESAEISAPARSADAEKPLTTSAAGSDAAAPPAVESSAALPDAPVPAPAVGSPAPVAFLKSGKPLLVSVAQLRTENRRRELEWKGLSLATSGAATFDAWSTRRAISRYGAQELNPLLKPFAGNASLYAAIQVAPALLDLAGRKMMYSSHPWVRHMWWVPQSASFVSSIFCGAHNLSYR